MDLQTKTYLEIIRTSIIIKSLVFTRAYLCGMDERFNGFTTTYYIKTHSSYLQDIKENIKKIQKDLPNISIQITKIIKEDSKLKIKTTQLPFYILSVKINTPKEYLEETLALLKLYQYPHDYNYD